MRLKTHELKTQNLSSSAFSTSSTACQAGADAGHIHLCQVPGNTPIPYGKWRSVANRN